MSGWAVKRFWQAAEVTPAEGGFTVTLDGRTIRTPAKALLVVPTRPLAEAIAEEWRAQDGEIRPLTMPFTRTANAALDKVAPSHAEVAAMLAEYGDADVTCYRADTPAELVARQAAAWDPLLDWAHATYGARLRPRTGITHAPQDPTALARLAARVQGLPAFHLTALHDLVALSGSLVIGLAALDGAFPVPALWQASRVDEIWQEQQWGRDEEATGAAERRFRDFRHAREVLDLVQGEATAPSS